MNDPTKARLEELHPQINILKKYNSLIETKLNYLDEIENEIIERRKRWHDFITETEIKEKLLNELQLLIPQCREKFDRMVRSKNYCSDLVTGFLTVNSKIQENHYYETEKAP